MTQKERQVFALKNFRGLDKENKLLKVENYRASDGYNFIIDSETLKTRPSFTVAHNPNFFLEANEYLIDWHIFGSMYVYITNKHIKIFNGVNVVDETSISGTSANNHIIKGTFLNAFNFAGLKPFFQEEKECLFIFGLGDIFVVSKYTIPGATTYSIPILYSLSNKRTNPFPISSDAFIFFESLPTAYVPTIWLGDKVFEDINLLSNKSKYKLFANQPATAGVITYNLPTYYNKEKHGDFSSSNIGVSFYKGKYDGFPAYPVFMGVQGENWFGGIDGNGVVTAPQNWGSNLPSFDGTILNLNNPYVIENTFYPEQTFEYTNHNPEQIIYEEYGLTKEKFFEMIVKGTENQTVFEFLMSYISANKNAIGSTLNTGWNNGNRVLVFSIRAQYEAILRDNQDRDIIKKEIRWKDFNVYVQIRKVETSVAYTSETTKFNEVITTSNASYPAYPAATNASQQNTFEIDNGTPIQVQDFTPYVIVGSKNGIKEVDTIAYQYLASLPSGTLVNNTWYAIKMKLYQTTLVSATSRSIVMPTLFEQDVLEYANGNYLAIDGPVYPEYPTFSNGGFSVYDFGTVVDIGGNGQFTFEEGSSERAYLITRITDYINSSPQNFDINLGFGIFKIKMGRLNTDYGDIINLNEVVYNTTAVVVKVAISPALVVQEQRRSITYETRISTSNILVSQNAFSTNLKENNSLIELKVKDYFYDYKNEPAIEVLVSYQQNTDYNIIAKSKFGITFGSENRVFLAGNSDFPNIDRFNVSNDLLGDNVDNQSYELSYFPSKNYRVLGGKGAINGYVIATDNQLYVTKEDYPNDSKLFIRQRNVDNQGQVSYIEYKTNITKSPLNNRCLVRFYNDILVLSKDGLYGIEISQNALTDERLVRLRSGFINKELVKAIANYDNSKIFIVENNIYMYIFIGGIAYVADSRYISQNPNSAAENVSYELIEWKNNFVDTSTPMQSFISAKVINDVIYFIEENNNFIYTLQDFNADDLATKDVNEFTLTDFQEQNQSQFKVFQISSTLYNQIATSASNASKYVFKIIQTNDAYIYKATSNTDYTYTNGTFSNINPVRFANISNGDRLYFRGFSPDIYNYFGFTVSNLTSNSFQATNNDSGTFTTSAVYEKVTNKDLYITAMYQYNGQYFIRLSNLKPDTVVIHSAGTSLTTIRTDASFGGLYNNITFSSNTVVYGAIIIKKNPIKLRWVSGITDFGNSQMEKTSFRMNLYATKKELTNTVTFGYRTMRRLVGFTSPIDLSNNFNFNEVNFNNYNLASFDTTAVSLPMKENNFLYIQFILDGSGKIEMNSVEVIYKNNRMLKSVG